MENPEQVVLEQASREGWTGNGLQLGREMAGERERENTLSPLQNGDVRRTHSFLTAWCTSVRPWGSSSGPWGRPESAWSWGERTAQGNAKQFVVLMSGWTLSDIQCCKQVGTLPETHWCAGGNDWSLTSFLPVFSHVMLETIRNTEHLGLWYNSQQSCLLQMAFHCNVVLDCAEQRVPAPNSFAASVFISCLRSTTVWISSKPKPALWTPQMHFQRLGLFGIFEQNISVSGKKKKKNFGQDPSLLWGKRGTSVGFSAGKMLCGKSIWTFVASWIPAVSLETSTFVFQAPFSTICRLYFLWYIAVLPYTMIYAQKVCLVQQADVKWFDSDC